MSGENHSFFVDFSIQRVSILINLGKLEDKKEIPLPIKEGEVYFQQKRRDSAKSLKK